MARFERDENDWLKKHSPAEWIRAALGELKRAQASYDARSVRAAHAGCKRAAGMALNAVLILEPKEGWGRTYVEHVEALAKDTTVPAAVREACARVLGAGAGGLTIVPLRSKASDTRVLDAAHDVIAHAYAVLRRHDGDAD
jgi:hypothetical protein